MQDFREPLSWDVGGTDSPTAAMASIRTLLFMHGLFGDVISHGDDPILTPRRSPRLNNLFKLLYVFKLSMLSAI